MIKALFFDFDGVLTMDKTGSLTTTRYLSHATGIEHMRVKAAFARFNEDLIRGKCTHASIWDEVCRDIGTNIDIALLDRAFASTPIDDEMLALAKRLRCNYVVGMITDNKQDRMDCLERLHRLSSLFCPVVVSAAVGSTKNELFSSARLTSAARSPLSASSSITPLGTSRCRARWESTRSTSTTKHAMSPN